MIMPWVVAQLKMFLVLRLKDNEPPGAEFVRLNIWLTSHECISSTGSNSFEASSSSFFSNNKLPATLSL